MQLSIETMTYGPDGLAHTPEGKAVFVRGGLVGDVVEARIVEDGPSFSRAEVEAMVEPSPERAAAPCPLVGVCGGCPWGGLSYGAQTAAKEENLRSSLERIGGFDAAEVARLVKPLQPAKRTWGYRNKIELAPDPAADRFTLGLHGRDPRRTVRVKSCPLFEKQQAKAVKSVCGALGYLGNSRELGIERVGVRASHKTGALEVALWTATGAFPRAQVARVLQDALPQATSIVRVMQKGPAKARKVTGVEVLAGEGSWCEELHGQAMRVSAPSFFQVNTNGADALIKLVMDALDPAPDESAIDLYCGAGTFTVPLAQRCTEVFAVESYGPAVRDLRRNLDMACLGNAWAIGGDAVREFPLEGADVLVVDPPRAGLAPEVVGLIAQTSARAVAYVSCDPATLARDLRRFREEGTFAPDAATPVDLFPQTYHCETVVLLTRTG